MIYTDIEQIKSDDQQWGLILADPPWQQSRGGKKNVRRNSSGKDLDYATLSIDDIKKQLEIVTSKTSDNAILFLWTIDKYLFEAQQLAELLNWKLHARMIWDKITGPPASFDIRFAHEYLLYMYKGKFISADKKASGKYASVFRDDAHIKRKHSTKPEISFQIIEALYPEQKKIEMYARKSRIGWDSFGNELDDQVRGGVDDEVQIESSAS